MGLMKKSEQIQDILEKTSNYDKIREGETFDPYKKTLILELYQSLGLKYKDLMHLGQRLQTKNDSIPQDFLKFGESIASDSNGRLLEFYSELIKAYTPFPYATEKSAKLIKDSLIEAEKNYDISNLVIQYTTKLNPDTPSFGDVLGMGSFSNEHYGKLDLIGGLVKLVNTGTYEIVVFDLLRATNDFLEFRVVIAKTSETGELTKNEYAEKVRFDSVASELKYRDKICEIPDGTLEHYVCKYVFKNRKVPAEEDDILEKTVKSQSSQRAVTDAVNRVNKKAERLFGLKKLLYLKAGKVRISKIYQ